jgi:hypothetical protein
MATLLKEQYSLPHEKILSWKKEETFSSNKINWK